MLLVGLILSLAIGLSLGLLGGGGSTLTVPVLHYAFGVEAHDAIATSLIVVAATSLAALVSHARAGRVRWSVGLTFGLASMAAAYIGGRISRHLPGDALIQAFAVVMATTGIVMLLRGRRTAHVTRARERGTPMLVAIGLGVGLLTGVLGAGGGFLIVPALTLAGVAMHQAVATSLLVIAMNSTAALAGTASHASIDLRLAALVTLIAVSGSVIGTRFSNRVAARDLQRGFGWFVITVAIVMLAREGV